jgi:hypothetical protein
MHQEDKLNKSIATDCCGLANPLLNVDAKGLGASKNNVWNSINNPDITISD